MLAATMVGVTDPVITQLQQEYEQAARAWAQVQNDLPYDPGVSQHQWRLFDKCARLEKTLIELGYRPSKEDGR